MGNKKTTKEKKAGLLKKKASRKIPQHVDKAVKEKHFFQCAWCGENLYDRHHIFPFGEGGLHTEENLILLCPNCHRQVHDNKVDLNELKSRKSTHLKGDRISGSFQFNMSAPIFKIGAATFTNVPIL